MNSKSTVSEVLAQRIQERCKDLIDEYNAEKDPRIRIETKYDLARELLRQLIIEISKLKDADWRRFVREQIKPLEEAWEKLGKEWLDQKLAHGELSWQDMKLLLAEAEVADEFAHRRLTKVEKEALARRRTLERVLALTWIGYAQLYLSLGALGIALDPLSQIINLVEPRFGADENWVLSIAALAAHENLVKKKLVELGVADGRIEKVSRDKGFGPLVALLEKEIENKEKRQVSLAFYKSSSIRAIRNKLEHEGYKQKVTKDEMLDLVRDIRRFEGEIFRKSS